MEAPARRTGRPFDDCLACADVALVPGKNDLATVRPDISEEWHPTRNPLPASAVFPDFKQQVQWLGRCGHEWRAPIAKRVNSRDGALCSYCSGRKALKGFNDVATLCPELVALWHPMKNRNLTPDAVSIASHREVYLWDGVMTRIWRQNPRKWLEEHGRVELLAPFDSLVEEARALGARATASGTASPAQVVALSEGGGAQRQPRGMVPAVRACGSAGAMGRRAERDPQAVRRLALRFRPSVVARRVRPQLAAVREDEGVQ